MEGVLRTKNNPSPTAKTPDSGARPRDGFNRHWSRALLRNESEDKEVCNEESWKSVPSTLFPSAQAASDLVIGPTVINTHSQMYLFALLALARGSPSIGSHIRGRASSFRGSEDRWKARLELSAAHPLPRSRHTSSIHLNGAFVSLSLSDFQDNVGLATSMAQPRVLHGTTAARVPPDARRNIRSDQIQIKPDKGRTLLTDDHTHTAVSRRGCRKSAQGTTARRDGTGVRKKGRRRGECGCVTCVAQGGHETGGGGGEVGAGSSILDFLDQNPQSSVNATIARNAQSGYEKSGGENTAWRRRGERMGRTSGRGLRHGDRTRHARGVVAAARLDRTVSLLTQRMSPGHPPWHRHTSASDTCGSGGQSNGSGRRPAHWRRRPTSLVRPPARGMDNNRYLGQLNPPHPPALPTPTTPNVQTTLQDGGLEAMEELFPVRSQVGRERWSVQKDGKRTLLRVPLLVLGRRCWQPTQVQLVQPHQPEPQPAQLETEMGWVRIGGSGGGRDWATRATSKKNSKIRQDCNGSAVGWMEWGNGDERGEAGCGSQENRVKWRGRWCARSGLRGTTLRCNRRRWEGE
ncbi:hypothetical protein B0H14DRAFT_2643400 [Mycena olivaceomarginata]|nr:hypothetical protein B0H14DRAFT_2643400 [Mycena olivaceomarginata]